MDCRDYQNKTATSYWTCEHCKQTLPKTGKWEEKWVKFWREQLYGPGFPTESGYVCDSCKWEGK